MNHKDIVARFSQPGKKGSENMAANTTVADQTSGAAVSYTTHTVTSRDGTTISYRQIGRGPGVVILHGAMETSASHMQLATALADQYTFFAPDRRGRGLSGPAGADYSMRKEVEDLDALLTQTGAQYVMGVSAGGLILLQAALELPAIRKAALFEPALVADRARAAAMLAALDRDLDRGDTTAALITGMKSAEMGPAFFRSLPNWLLERLTGAAMSAEEKKAQPGEVTMRMLAPTLHLDFTLVAEMAGSAERFRDIQAQPFLMGGSKSPAYLKAGLDALQAVLPQAERVTFPGLDHGATGPTAQGGKPEMVAPVLARFFA
jgi:pimeloyl-ACP methyl ester carboxylesterase